MACRCTSRTRRIYPEKHVYMGELKRALDARGHALPTGTGKTAALISFITSYSAANPSRPLRVIYCTRTVHEMEKTLAELRLLFAHLPHSASRSLLALGLSSRKNRVSARRVGRTVSGTRGTRRQRIGVWDPETCAVFIAAVRAELTGGSGLVGFSGAGPGYFQNTPWFGSLSIIAIRIRGHFVNFGIGNFRKSPLNRIAINNRDPN
jgi:hypothetical protein